MKKIKKILLTGGGTGGPVTPLLAFFEDIKDEKMSYEFLWIGTKDGIEESMVKSTDMNFKAISSGKLRRYFSLDNFFDIFRVIKGIFDSFRIIKDFKPNIMMSAGGFVSVPVAIACYIKKIPIIIHQQDAKPGLANKMMAPLAQVITVTLRSSLKDYGRKAILLGNPVRKAFKENKITKREAMQKLNITEKLPIVLVMGGGTGAEAINDIVRENVDELTNFCQVIHITGKNKSLDFPDIASQNKNYQCFEFLNTEGMLKVFSVCDLIVSRCGMNVLTEISFFSIPAILIPMPKSHQEDNAEVFADEKAAKVLNQNEAKRKLLVLVKDLLNDKKTIEELKINLKKVIKIAEKDSFKEVLRRIK